MCTCDNSWISDRVPIKLDTGNSLLKFVTNINYCLKSEGRNKHVHVFFWAQPTIYLPDQNVFRTRMKKYTDAQLLHASVYVIFVKSESTEDS